MADWEAEGFLEGLDGSARAERVELLDWLESEGFDRDRIDEAHERGLLPFLPAERVVAGNARYTGAEVAERSGIPEEVLIQLRRAHGLPIPEPDEPAFSDNEIETAQIALRYAELGLNTDQMEAVARVMGRGLGQAAEVMRAVVLEMALEPGASELDLAQRYAELVEGVMPLVGPMLEGMVRLHLRQMVATEAVDALERRSGRLPGARDVTVAFADLVGFTRLGEEVAPDELGAVADRLARLTSDVLAPPVRLVKTIGDAVMLVSPEPDALLASALQIVAAVEEQSADFPMVHVGAAHGPALSRAGDWYGRPVNLASRVTAIARAGSVLATEEVKKAAGDAVNWSFAGERRIKGLPAPVPLFRARPLERDR